MLRRVCARRCPASGKLELKSNVAADTQGLNEALSDLEELSSRRHNGLEIEQFGSAGRPLHAISGDSRVSSSALSEFRKDNASSGTSAWSRWLGGDYFLCVEVKEGSELDPGTVTGNLVRATCDPFVRVALQRNSPGGGAPVPLAEAETRVVYRNAFPKWEECLPFPLDDVTEDTSIVMRLYDKDIGHFNSFVSLPITTVSLPMTTVLAGITDLGQSTIYQLPLQDRQGVQRRKGALLFGVSILEKAQYTEMRAVIKKLQDPDKIHSQLGGYRLHLKVHAFKNLTCSSMQGANLAAEVKLCCYESRLPLRCLVVDGEASPTDLELAIPLGAAFQEGGVIKGKDRLQFGDVRIDLYAGKTRVAKTQVPIWDVPYKPDPPPPEDLSRATAPAFSSARISTPEGKDGGSTPGGKDRGSTPGGIDMKRQPTTDSPPGSPRATRADANSSSSSFLGSLTANLASALGKNRSGTQPETPFANPSDPLPSLATVSAPPAPPPTPPPLWEGKRYCRRMERLGGQLGVSPMVEVSMQLVPASEAAAAAAAGAGGGSGGGGGVDFDADDDEAAEPLAAPAPYDHVVADFVVAAGPQAVCRAVYGPGSELADRITAADGMTDVQYGTWAPDPDGKALLVQTMNYMKPTPVGPTAVVATMRVISKGPGGFLLRNTITPNVPPVGQCVNVQMQVVGTLAGPGKTRLTASLKTEWFKSGMMVSVLKGKVDSATPGDSRKWFATMQRELAATFGGDGGGAGITVDAAGGAATVASAGGAVLANPAGATPGPSSLLAALTSPSVLLLLVSWTIALLAVFAFFRISSRLADANKAVAQLAEALAALPGRLAPALQQCGEGAGLGPAGVGAGAGNGAAGPRG
ncbi:hypothetical protein HYH03_010448 [Edaphochlamys debaryana]|uniref:C2 domain-containing protein n=1 Tax=Edaphochlamys debaryana TaxID=47281 RepID=A0A835Y293_9CHLO|nr:hypothetical protein HYH03_010448 [Edaphochlamys debaryana]|eukprot:KAG2491240.1 hypothetical protein HYH03_010448 [Edaphochlamys debaryana]